MKILNATGSVDKGYGAIAICLFEDEIKSLTLKNLDRATVQEVKRLISASGFTGKKNESAVHFPEKSLAPLIILQGLGARKNFKDQTLRLAAGSCIRSAVSHGAKSLALVSEDKLAHDHSAEQISSALVQGLILGAWKFDHFKSKKDNKQVAKVTVYYSTPERKRTADRQIQSAEVMANCYNLCREWGTLPTNVVTVDYLTKKARELSKKKVKVSTVEVSDMKKLGMNLFVAVGQASVMPPRLVIMDWNPKGAKKTYAFIGKGMVFDSGGLNIKVSMMEEMKSDMCGAAVVLAAMYGIAELKPKVRVIGMLACAENAIGGNAYRPSDIYSAMNGKTVEIGNTDAEGRLVLADSLCYANKKYKLDGVIDVATLTGAAVVALGHQADAIFTNNDKFQNAVLAAAERGGDRLWPMPNYEEYIEDMRSPIADLNNSAGHRWGGACTAAAFLKEFVSDTPWVHIDIAPTSIDSPTSSIQPKATAGGQGVRTLLELVTK